MILVKVDSKYTDYLRKFDKRVSYNINKTYERPYVGVLIKLRNKLEYFAPLTSSRKGNKLKTHPKKESITFYPIRNCELGGVNFNNMMPLIKSVYKKIDILKSKDQKLKFFYINQVRELNSKENILVAKARKIYALKISKKLYKNYDSVTCDFKLLESKALKYKK